MPSKFDRLRAGEVVEIEPGRKGRLNVQNKTFETSDGRKVFVGDDEDFFPSSEEGLKHSQTKEEIERGLHKVPGGEFLFQLGQHGVLGGIKDWGNKLVQSGDEYVRGKRAQAEVSEKISERSPTTSGAATVASFIPDLYLTRGMSAAKAAPILTGLAAGPRILEEPAQVAGEAAMAAGGGFLLDKAGGYLNRVAQRRAASRALPGQQEAVRAQNVAGEASTAQANLQQKQQFNALQERAKNENAALLHQHNLTLNDRQNKMIQSQNAFEQAKAAREAEVFRLKNEYETAKATRSGEAARLENEYKAAKSSSEQETRRLNEEFKLAQKQYEETLRSMPKLQKEAQAEYSKNVLKNVQDIEKAFPKDSRIIGKQIGTQEFIEESINTTGLAGSREGAQASRILKSLFPEGDILTAKELSKRYQAIEDAIQRASPEVQGILNQFKQHLGERLPMIAEDTIAYSKIMPSLSKQIEKDIALVIKDIPFGRGEEATRNLLVKTANSNLKNLMREIGPEDFVRRLESGEIGNTLRDKLLTSEDFLTDSGFSNFAKMRREGTYDLAQKALSEKHTYFTNEIGQRINNTLARNEIKAMAAGREARKKLGRTVKKTYGLAEPVAPPISPIAPEPIAAPQAPGELPPIAPPQFPGPLTPPQTPPMPFKPPGVAEPTAPIPQSFSPQPAPTLAPASGMAERTGDFLEKNLLGGKGLVDNPLTKLAGLKYLLGKAALPAEAAYLGMKGLTSPTAAGATARLSFKRAGIQAIEMLAQKYPSYHDGILENPQERRSLTKEVEDDPEIPIEQKALIQSKINRGKPLQDRLQ